MREKQYFLSWGLLSALIVKKKKKKKDFPFIDGQNFLGDTS